MEINAVNNVGNTPEPKKVKKTENKPVIEQKTAPASAQDAAAGYGRAMLYIPKISFGQARHETKIPIGLIDYAQAEKVGPFFVNKNGNWCVKDKSGFIDTGIPMFLSRPEPSDGDYIVPGTNGNWFEGFYKDTGISAKDVSLAISEHGTWIVNGEDIDIPVSDEMPVIIGENGNLMKKGNFFEDTGIPCDFPKPKPEEGHFIIAGENGNWFVGYYVDLGISEGKEQTGTEEADISTVENKGTEQDTSISESNPATSENGNGHIDGEGTGIAVSAEQPDTEVHIVSSSIDPESGHLLVEYSDGTIEDNGEVPGYFPSKSIDDGEQDTVAPAPEEQPDTEVRIVSSFIDPKSGYIIQKFNDGTLVDTGVYPEENTETTPSLSETVPEPSETIDREAIKASVKAKIEELPRKIKAHLQGVEITDANAPTADKILSDEKLLNNRRFMTHAKEIISAVKTPEQEKVVDVMLQQESVLDNKTFMSHAADLIAICGDIFDESEIEVSIKNNAFADNKRGLEVISAYQKGKSAIEHTSDMYNPKTTKKEIKEMVQEKIAYLPEKVAEKLKRVRITDKNVFFIDTITSDKNIMKNRLFMNNLPRIASNITNEDQASLAMLVAYDENLNSNKTFMEHSADVISVGQELFGNRVMITALMYDGVVNNKKILETFSHVNKVKNSDPVSYRLSQQNYKFELSSYIRSSMSK